MVLIPNPAQGKRIGTPKTRSPGDQHRTQAQGGHATGGEGGGGELWTVCYGRASRDPGQSNNLTFYIEVQVRKEREALLVAAARKAQSEPVLPVSNLPAQHKAAQPNRHHLCHAGPLHATDSATPKCCFSRAGGFPKVPATAPPRAPCVFRSPALFSAFSQYTGSPAFVWCLPVISTFQRHSAQHPSIVLLDWP
jgi:hypothetical protein